MKYIVWDLISRHDGYGKTDCKTWDEAVAAVEQAVNFYGHSRLKQLLNQWKKGKVNKIEMNISKEKSIEIFVTTQVLNKPAQYVPEKTLSY